ncbi:MAG TPA: nucleoside recognition domain-containing protein [Cyclobacteriaceae bacterium]|nr:nucleoside recognition domain-containing protein [Cyclobacteriaceae bacterium]
MALNYIWVSFFLIAFVVALAKLIFFNDTEVFPALLASTFDSARTGFEISLYLTGVMALWLGLMKIGEKGGMVPLLARLVGPFFSRLFPEVPRDHPATGSIIMNFSANILGLDNAATPLGLKAMKELQDINPDPDTASNAQITFLVLNTSGLTIIPLAIIVDRASLGSVDPTAIFIPTLIATFFSTMIGLLYLSIRQRIRLIDPVLLAYIGGLTAIIVVAVTYFLSLPPEELQQQSSLISSLIIVSLIVGFLVLGLIRKVRLFETFVEGAKEGFTTSVKIIPYLVAMLVGIGVFRASGALDHIISGIGSVFAFMGMNTDFVDALPVALLKPLSGTAARGMMLDVAHPDNFGPDSFVGNLAAILRGCTETTFYILAVYFGSVNIRNSRYALTAGLIADLAGLIAGVFVAYLFFH